MGADIHPYFEKRKPDGTWEPLWGWGLDPMYWWESIADEKADNGAGSVVLEQREGETVYDSVVRYFKSMPLDEATERYGMHPRTIRTFNSPDDDRNVDWGSRFGSRDYSFFAALASVRGYGYKPKGVPEDVSPVIGLEIERYGGDGHSHTWFMCSEMLADPKLNNFPQVKTFIPKHIADPENTRVVIYFDN